MPNADLALMIAVLLGLFLAADYLRWRKKINERRRQRVCERNLSRMGGRP